MIYQIEKLPKNRINPITGQEYDSSWIIFELIDSIENYAVTGVGENGAYSIKLSRVLNDNWYLSVGDFIGYCETNNLNGIIVISEADYNYAINHYDGHCYNESILRRSEPSVLIHSTTENGWKSIQCDGMLKSWNVLKAENAISEKCPIGTQLGDLDEFSSYIMFGGGVSGEIVVNSKLCGYINMDANSAYHTGARLYFDAERMAHDGLLVRDGTHIKVKDKLPLSPYLLWVATWDVLGFESPVSTPKIFADTADEQFKKIQQLNI